MNFGEAHSDPRLRQSRNRGEEEEDNFGAMDMLPPARNRASAAGAVPAPHHLRPETEESNNKRRYAYQRSKVASGKILRSGYFSLESLILLIGLTASLLILPLILPPLPPPPFLLLLIPIGILFLLMALALTPSNAADFACTPL